MQKNNISKMIVITRKSVSNTYEPEVGYTHDADNIELQPPLLQSLIS